MTRSSEADQAARVQLRPAEFRRIILGLMIVILLSALDQTILATAMPTIGRELGDARHLPWVVTAYLLAGTGAVPIYGKFADIYGRRIVLLVSISIFLCGSVLCALAPNMAALIAARFVQGSGAGLLALSQTIIGDILTPRERANYQTHISLAFITAGLAGPILGGFFSQHLGWPMIFWVNLPLGLLAISMTSAPLRRLPRHERKHRFDIMGAILLVASTTSLLLTIAWSGTENGWRAPLTLALAVASAALILLFFMRLHRAPEPLIPPQVLADKVVLTATLAATASSALFLGLSVYAPVFLEALRGLSPSQSGVALVPLMVGTVIGATISGRAMARVHHYKRIPLVALPFGTAAALAIAVYAVSLPTWILSLLLAVISMALGTILPISTISVQNAVPPHQLGTTTATISLFRRIGGAVVVAVLGAVVIRHSGGELIVRFAHRSTELMEAKQIMFGLVAAGTLVAFGAIMMMEERPLGDAAHRAGVEQRASQRGAPS